MRRALNKIWFSPVRYSLILLTLIFIFSVPAEVKAQDPPPPPRPIKVNVTSQNLSFGAFTFGAFGGTVTVSEAGVRSATGDVILLGLGYMSTSCMILIEANPGTIISMIYSNVGPLTNGTGGSMALQIIGSSPQPPFVTEAIPPLTTPLYIGGRLTVGNAVTNPPGSYNGTFDIVFNQE